MRYRHSLRFRILTAFVISGVVLGPVLALLLLTISYELEELGIERVLTRRLEQVVRSPADFPLVHFPGIPGVAVLGDVPLAELPRDIGQRTAGLYELEPVGGLEYEGRVPKAVASDDTPTQRSWYLAVEHANARTFVVAENITALEYRERLTLWTVGGGTLLAVYLSLWLGYYLSRRLVEPVRQLAQTVSRDGGGSEAQSLLAGNYPRDEIGELAEALDRYRQRIHDALEREQEFSAHVSHELRNPLAVIHSALELMETEPHLRPATRRAVARAYESASEMGETVSALLLLARESRSPGVYPPIDVAAIVSRVVAELTADTSLEVRWEALASPSLHAPEIAIRAIAANLIKNALQSTPAGGVSIQLSSDHLAITDTGVGIPAEELSAIRERGTRASNARGTGSGVGLALVDRLCDTFAWRVTMTSELDRGTTAEWWFS